MQHALVAHRLPWLSLNPTERFQNLDHKTGKTWLQGPLKVSRVMPWGG